MPSFLVESCGVNMSVWQQAGALQENSNHTENCVQQVRLVLHLDLILPHGQEQIM
jgi:hypothetical protein